MKFLRICFLFISLLVLLPTASHAQDGDTRVQEIMSSVSPENEFVFFGLPDMQAGSTIYLYAESDEINTWIGICDLKCEETLVENDDIDADNANSALSYTFEASGDYIIFVTDCCRSEITGSFRLLVGINAPDVLTGAALPTGAIIAQNYDPFGNSDSGTLTVENNSEETICYVFVSPVTADEWGEDQLSNDEFIEPDSLRQFAVEPGSYDVLLLDCNQDTLQDIRDINVTETFVVTYPDDGLDNPLAVYDLIDQGYTILGNGRITEAIDIFHQALDLARENNDRMAEGLILDILGLLHDMLGQPVQALEYYQEGLEIWRELGDREGEATSLVAIGGFYSGQFQYDQALEHYQQALVIWRELGDREQETKALNNIGDLYLNQGQAVEAMEYFQQALEIQRELGDRDGEANTLNNIGDLFLNLGQATEALDNFEQALEIQRDIGDQWGQGITLNNIAFAYGILGPYTLALDYHQQSLAIWRALGDLQGEVTTLNAIGVIFQDLGQYDQALAHHDQALTIAREADNPIWEATALISLGGVYVDQGQYALALEHFQQVLVIWRVAGNRIGEGSTLGNMAQVYHKQGQYALALETYEQSLSIWHEIGDQSEEGTVLGNMGSVYADQGQYALALELYLQALDISRDTGDRAVEGSTLLGIGGLYYDLGQYDQALNHLQQALVIWRDLGDRGGEGTTLNNIGVLNADQGQYSEALSYYQQALSIWRDLGVRSEEATSLNNVGVVLREQEQGTQALENFELALAIATDIGDRDGEGTVLGNMGGVYMDQGQYDLALDYYQQALEIQREAGNRAQEATVLINIGSVYDFQEQTEQAIQFYTQAADVVESIHADIRLESGQASFAAEQVSVYDRLVALLANSDPEQAFHYAERGRARSFLFQLSNERLTFGEGADSELLEEWQAKRDELAALRETRVELFSRPRPSEEALNELDSAINRAELQLAQLEDRIAISNPAHNQLVQIDVPALAKLQAAIPDNTTLLAFYVVSEVGSHEGQALAFVLTNNSLEVVQLEPSPGDLITAIEAFRGDETATASLEQLYEWLITPLTGYLSTSNLVIVPHGVLNYLPFAALTADGTNYLSDEFLISYTPSVTVYETLQDTRPPAPTSENWLILGNPTPGDNTLPPLPGAEAEAEAVSTILNANVYLGQAATEDLLREQIGQVDGIHISAHGIFNVNNTLSSYLALTPGTEHDGLLEVREIYALPLEEHAPMVVLSACETAVNELAAGDEFQGLTRAFLLSGARVVLASQWAVEDEATAVLMTAFYQNRGAGMNDAEALAAAQRTVRENAEHPEWASPFYWAAFQLVGLAN